MIAYGDGWRALFTARAEITGGQLLRLALNGVAIYIIFRHSANWVSRELGEMDWIQNSFFVALLIFIISLAGVLALGAEKVIEGYIPPPYWRRIGIITAAALSVGSAVFALVRYLS